MGGKRSEISGELQDLASRLDSTVLRPLELIERSLEKNWDDAAAAVFLKRLALHEEIIKTARRELERIGDFLQEESGR